MLGLALAEDRSECGWRPPPAAGGSDLRKPVQRLTAVFRRGLFGLTLFTFFVDVLLLVQPIYMLQVYDRVLASGSIETLLYISLMAAGALLLLGVVDAVRSMMAGRLAAEMEVEAGGDALIASLGGQRARLGDVQPLRDLGAVRGFISSKGILAYLDLPFAPLFILMLYVIHPHLFWMTTIGAVVLTLMALANQWATTKQASDSSDSTMNAMLSAQAFARNAESINAMGMTGNVISAWGRAEAVSLEAQDRMNWTNSVFAGASRVIRLGLQIAILGYGGYLVLKGEMTSGMIFASSLISGRGLQPIDQVIGGWRGFVEARKAWSRLKTALERNAADRIATDLPPPTGRIRLDQLVVYAPGVAAGAAPEPLLKRVSADIAAGECIVVIGPSGAGKSTLVRALVGAVPLNSGVIRIDGADIRTWDRERLGRHFGYLAQEVDLLPGTVAENIARFTPGSNGEAIVAAAKMAHVHELILGLPKGYDTVIGPAGQQLSGGQRQRVGLARAFFGAPKILILDEPNANLDTDGELALDQAVQEARAAGTTVLIVTQRRPIAERADKIMILRDGAVEDFGPRADVVARQMQRAAQAQQAQQAQQAANAQTNLARVPPTGGAAPAGTAVSTAGTGTGRFPTVIGGGAKLAGE